MHHKVHPGFTLSEVLISLLLVGVLATIMVPSINKGMNQTTQLNAVRTGATELVQAYNRLESDGTSSISAMTTAQDIVDRMNYVRIINDNAQQTTVIDSGGGEVDTPCGSGLRCALLQSGAYLQYNPQSVFGENLTANINGIRFIIDPDGSGGKRGTELILFYGPRITTVPLYQFQVEELGYGAAFVPNVSTDGISVTGNDDDLPNLGTYAAGLRDPEYLEPWTEEGG